MEQVLQAPIDVEATGTFGAARYERTRSRTNQRNDFRDRLLTTKAGVVDPKIPSCARARSSRRF